MNNSKYRDQILERAEEYYRQYDGVDNSHDRNHFFRVEHTAKRMAEEEGADLEIIEAACLLFDVARILEDRGDVEDHALASSEIAQKILKDLDFPREKINKVCYTIKVHRRSAGITPDTIEAKILQDADYLDIMGATDITRVISSSIQSKQYRRPIYIEKSFTDDEYSNTSAIHHIVSQINHPRIKPENFYTKLGQTLAKERLEFMKLFVAHFLAEWEGKS